MDSIKSVQLNLNPHPLWGTLFSVYLMKPCIVYIS